MALRLALLALALVSVSLGGAEAIQIRGAKLCELLPWSPPVDLQTVIVPLGTTCSWILKGDGPYCVKSTAHPPKFSSPVLRGFNTIYRHKFTRLGSYPFSTCKKSPKFKGTILVIPANCGAKARCAGKCYGSDRCAYSCAVYPKKNKAVACNRCCKKGNKKKALIARCLRACKK